MGDTIRVTHVTLRFFLFLMSFAILKSVYGQSLKEKGQRRMKEKGKKLLFIGLVFIAAFIIWTVLIQKVDVQPIGAEHTNIGFATLNAWFHQLTGVNMGIYVITDWLGLIPILICMIFGGVGFIQWIKRRSIFRVDYDLVLMGIYYTIVIFGYLIFEMIPINYRPILIEGFLEASYPSSTTLLVLSVMPTLTEQVGRRTENKMVKIFINSFVIIFTAFMVLGRLLSGVHWITDIVGAVMLSAGLFCVYKAAVLLYYKEKGN
jgi:undecaprenyl-diphosphatase